MTSVLALCVQPAFADRFTSPSYTIDASGIGNSLSGGQTSTNYALTSAGGESVIGNGASGSYKLAEGYVAQLEQAIQLTVSPSTINLGTIIPGVSNSATVTANVITDAPDYTLAVSQNNNLQSGAYSIAAVGGSIASPTTWVEGTTKGLGFTLVSTNATAIPGTWNSGSAYAAFPNTSTTFYTRDGFSGGATDTLTMRVKVDVPSSQGAATYTNTVTWVGTTTP